MFAPAPKDLKLVQFNVENLFIFLDLYAGQDLKKVTEAEWQRFTTSTTPNKPLKKTWDIANIIKELDADIYLLNEVGGIDSLQNFNKHFLDEKYKIFLKEGNSHRGIDVGYLVRADLDFKFVHITHRDRPINFLYPHETTTPSGGKSHYFSRDVSELRLFRQDANNPSLVILLTHLKSKLDPEFIDPQGRLRRAAELKTLVQIYNEVRKELGGDSTVVVAGDFNGIAARDQIEPEFKPLVEETDLIDVIHKCDIGMTERYTQVQIDALGKQRFLQIDYIFLSDNAADRIVVKESGIYRFKDHLGQPFPAPTNMATRDLLPSDHYPVVLTLKLDQ